MHIKVQFSEDSLFHRMSEDDISGYDVPASKDRFAEHMVNHIYDRYPDAEIQVVESVTESVVVDGDTDHDEVPWIEQLVERVFNDADWEVSK